uniref:Sushi domain-containing protein n=1 Tax=Mola mola TaxID=94237 RepID=A0A3Q3VU77_MOLML
MCDGMIESISKACRAHTSATKLPVLLLLVQAMVSTGQGLGCERPYMVQNSWVNLTEANMGLFPVGTVLQYNCDPGYLPDRPSILTCTTIGRWSSEPPQCISSGACLPLSKPKNGGYTCHPSPCRMFAHGTVIEFFCDDGFVLSGDYNYLTCQDGQWDGPTQISCASQGCDPSLPLGMPALSIVASTASSVALILFLVVLFVLLQPRLKSLHR